MKAPSISSLRNWLPSRVVAEQGELLFRWLYMNDLPYTDPFFDETLSKCLSHSANSKRYKCVSSADMLVEWGEQIEALEPSALIFHVSRCGSTLLSQTLGIRREHISLSEVPVFDEILRFHIKDPHYKPRTGALLKAAIRFYGAKRRGDEKRLFIKTDSWHLMFFEELRALFPETPFIVLYRDPVEVLYSNQRKRGVQGVYGLVEPALFGLSDIAQEQRHPDIYMQLILKKYFEKIIQIAGSDKRTLLLNYNEGVLTWMLKTGSVANIPIDAVYRQAISERAIYSAKYPADKFAEPTAPKTISSPAIDDLMYLYAQAEQLRLRNITTTT